MNNIKYKINPKEYNKIIELYLNGSSSYIISDLYGVTPITITRILKKNNVPITGNNKYDYNDNKFVQIKNDYLNNIHIKELQLKYNIPCHIILKFLKKENVPYPIDEFLTFCFMEKKDHQLIFVVGKKNKIPVFFIIKGIFLKNHFKINDIFAPKFVKEITYEEVLIMKSRPTFNSIV